ncbi:unnamed protein product, partial [Polarella glacialis]
ATAALEAAGQSSSSLHVGGKQSSTSSQAQPGSRQAAGSRAVSPSASSGGGRRGRPASARTNGQDTSREVQLLRQQLAERDVQLAEERDTIQKLRADLIELKERSQQVMQLLVCTDSGSDLPDLPTERFPKPQEAWNRRLGPGSGQGAASRGPVGSVPVGAGGTPRTVRSSPVSWYGRGTGSVGLRPGMRPRSVQPHSSGGNGVLAVAVAAAQHSAGPSSIRHRFTNDLMP